MYFFVGPIEIPTSKGLVYLLPTSAEVHVKLREYLRRFTFNGEMFAGLPPVTKELCLPQFKDREQDFRNAVIKLAPAQQYEDTLRLANEKKEMPKELVKATDDSLYNARVFLNHYLTPLQQQALDFSIKIRAQGHWMPATRDVLGCVYPTKAVNKICAVACAYATGVIKLYGALMDEVNKPQPDESNIIAHLVAVRVAGFKLDDEDRRKVCAVTSYEARQRVYDRVRHTTTKAKAKLQETTLKYECLKGMKYV